MNRVQTKRACPFGNRKPFFLLLTIMIVNSYCCFSQKSFEIKDIYNKIQNYTPSYLRQAKAITGDILNEHSTFYKLEDKKRDFDDFNFIIIPMFDLDIKVSEYMSGKNILKYIEIQRKTNFNSIIIYRSDKYYATCSCTEYLPCSIIMPESEYDTTRSYVKELDIIRPLDEYFVFYIRGFLFTWWLVNKDGDLKIFYLNDEKFYEYNDFMTRFFPPEKIKIIVNNYYKF